MKIEAVKETVQGNSGSRKAFRIGASSKAFQILSSGIYKHKIRAIVRESACNANDAHIFAGRTDAAFEITVPSQLDPQYKIRDYGNGLSYEDIMEVYTEYFASTKSDDDEQTGAFGLGAKAPFAYTDTFSVKSWNNGTLSIYTAIINGEGPEMVRTYQAPSDEPSGLEVTVPVKPQDFDNWQNEISRVMRPFSKKSYTIIGDLKNPINSHEDFESYNQYGGEFFGSAQQSMRTEEAGIYAVYGGIVYPLKDTPGMQSSWLETLHQVVYVNFPLTDGLMPQPSREELQMDDRTIERICARVNRLNGEQVKETLDHLGSITNRRALGRAHSELTDMQQEALRLMGVNFLNAPVRAAEYVNFDDMVDYKGHWRVMQCNEYSPYNRRRVVDYKSRTSKYSSEVSLLDMYGFKIPRAFVLINDQKGKHIKATVQGLTIKGSQGIAGYPRVGDYITILTINTEMDQTNLLDLIKTIMEDDEVHIFKLSELEDVRKLVPGYGVKRTKDTAPRPKSPNVIRYAFDEKTQVWSTEDLHMNAYDLEDMSGYVLGLYNDGLTAMKYGFEHVKGIDKFEVIRYAKEELNIQEFFLIRPQSYKKILKNPECDCLFEAMLKDMIDEFENTPLSYMVFVDTYRDRWLSNLLRRKELSPVTLEFYGVEITPEIIALNEKLVRYSRISVPGVKAATLYRFDKIKVKYLNLVDDSKAHLQKRREAFSKAQPVLDYVLEQKYTLSAIECTQIAFMVERMKAVKALW